MTECLSTILPEKLVSFNAQNYSSSILKGDGTFSKKVTIKLSKSGPAGIFIKFEMTSQHPKYKFCQ